MSAIQAKIMPGTGLVKLLQNKAVGAVLAQLVVLAGAMLIAAQLRYQLPYGGLPQQIDLSLTLAVYVSLSVITLIVCAVVFGIGNRRGSLAQQPEKRQSVAFILSLITTIITVAYVFPAVSRLQLFYFAVAGVSLYLVTILWPARLTRRASNNGLATNLSRLYDQRILLNIWVKYNVRSRYSQAILGVLWIILLPISISLIMALVFSDFLHAQVGNVPFIVFLLPAIVPWGLFNYGVMTGTRSVLGMMHLITQVYFPREILVLVTLGEGLVDLFFTFIAMLIINALNGVWPNMYFIYLPVLLLIQISFTLGVMFYVSCLSVLIRDIPPLVAVLLQLMFYLTPIFYSLEAIPPRFHVLTIINPLAILIQGYRDIIMNGQPPDGSTLFYPAVVALVLLYTGYSFFKANEGQFADWL